MTYRISDWAWGLDLPPVEKLTMVALADMANAAGQTWPSQRLLGEMTSTSERTMRRVLQVLEEERRLIRRERRTDARGQRTSDLITLSAYAEPAANLAGRDEPPTGQHAEAQPANTPKPNRPTVAGVVEPPEGTPKNPQRARDDAEFEAFWGAYPRHAGSSKADARKAYWRAVAKVGSVAVMGGVIRFAKDPNLPEERFIPHASTWLNQERWDAEPLPSRGAAGQDLAGVVERARQRDQAAAQQQHRPEVGW